MTKVTRVKKNSGTNGKKGMDVIRPANDPSLPAPKISIRDFEKFAVLFSLNRGMSRAKAAKKFHLSYAQIQSIAKNHKLSDFPISAFEVAQGMQRLNAGFILLQQECMDAMTPEKLQAANLAQLSITMGIAADKTKQYDAHLSGSMTHVPSLPDFKTKEALIDRIQVLQKKQGIRVLEAEDAVVEDIPSESGGEETQQMDLFIQDNVESIAEGEGTNLGETEVLERNSVGTLRRRTGVEPRRPDKRPNTRDGTGYSGPGREEG